MVLPPRRISNISDSEDISHTNSRQKRQKKDNNAHFDKMIQSMSAAVNRDRRQRRASNDSNRSTALASELSFIKRTDTRRNSSASKASSETSSSHTCNPLPQWLVNTFMSLSKKNPLRLMLPTDISESNVPRTETIAQTIDISATGPSFVFDLPEPSDDDQENWLEPLPFSTPGPGSLLGSSVASNNIELSLRIPQKNLSTVSYANETYIGSNLPSNRSHTPVCPSDVLPSVPKENLSAVSYANETDIGSNLPSNRSHTPLYSSDVLPSVPPKNLSRVLHANESYISSNLPSNRSHTPVYSSLFLLSDSCFEDFATDEVGSSWKPSMPEEESQSLFSNIYSTSAPQYSAPRPVHFDSPLEDSMSSDHLHPGYEIDYDTIDFYWKPFDRKNLVVSDRLQKPIYASRTVHSNCASDKSEFEHAITPVNTETNTLNSYIFPARKPASPLLPISPAPFRFLVPPESDASSSVLKSQNQTALAIPKPSTPKNTPYFEVPGVYISPLDNHQKVHDTNPSRCHDEYADDIVEQANSQASNDSIESWEQNLC